MWGVECKGGRWAYPRYAGVGYRWGLLPPIRTILGSSTFVRPELSSALASCSALALSSRLGLSFHVEQSSDRLQLECFEVRIKLTLQLLRVNLLDLSFALIDKHADCFAHQF